MNKNLSAHNEIEPVIGRIGSGERFWSAVDGDSEETVYLERLLSAVRRQWPAIVVCAALGAVLGVVYASFAIPLYTSSMSLMIDSPQRSGGSEQPVAGSAMEDDAAVVSELALLSSKTLAYTVVDQLRLDQDVEFLTAEASLVRGMINGVRQRLRDSGILPALPPASPGELRRLAVSILERNVRVSRVERSYVLSLDYTSPSPELSAKIAAAFADAYVMDKLNSRFESTRRSSLWLQDRIQELSERANQSDLAVQLFREQNNLVTADGKLVNDQQLSELNSALIIARSDVAQAKARVDRINAILRTGDSGAIVPDVLESPVSNDLRSKYLEAAKREAELTNLYGRNHSSAQRFRAEMNEYRRLLFEELKRIAESYQSVLEVAVAREEKLNESVTAAELRSVDASKTQVQLRELERSAETYKKLHETFLQRYHQTVQEQSFPMTGARVIEPAEVPTAPAFPNKPLIVALYTFLGVAVGGALGGLREIRDRFFRTGDQVRKVLRVDFLGSLPVLPLRKLPRRPKPAGAAGRSVVYRNSFANYAVQHPRSMYAETLRSAKIAVDLASGGSRGRIVGFLSALPNEGKSTVSVNFAQLIASQGGRVLLVDADLRNMGATHLLAATATRGITDVLMGEATVDEVVLRDAETGLAFLPAVTRHLMPNSADLISSERMRAVMASALSEYDYVVLDLPPLGPVIDARAVAPWIDNFVFVVEWGRVSQRMVKETLFTEGEILRKTRGVILNKVDTRRLKNYQTHGSAEYYYPTYHSYYK